MYIKIIFFYLNIWSNKYLIMNNDELINNFNKINNEIIKLNNYKNNIINDIDIIKYLIIDNNNNNTNNNNESFFTKQEYINMKLNNEIKNINYNIQETSIDISCKFNKILANFIKEQKETNKKLKDELIELRNIINNSNNSNYEKIKDLYYNIFYISLSFIFITIFI